MNFGTGPGSIFSCASHAVADICKVAEVGARRNGVRCDRIVKIFLKLRDRSTFQKILHVEGGGDRRRHARSVLLRSVRWNRLCMPGNPWSLIAAHPSLPIKEIANRDVQRIARSARPCVERGGLVASRSGLPERRAVRRSLHAPALYPRRWSSCRAPR